MALSTRLRQSSLARRLLIVIFFAVLVPVFALTGISYLQVREQLVEQSLSRLERDTQAVTQSVLERLSLAQGLSGGLTPEEAARSLSTAPAPGELRPLEKMVWTDASGVPELRAGDWSGTPTATPDLTARLRVGTGLTYDAERREVVLARQAAGGVLWTTVDTTFLWSSVSELARLRGEGRSCILTNAAELLRCDPGFREGALVAHLGQRTPFQMEIDGIPHQAVTRPVFLDWAFGSDPWHVVVAEPVSAAVGPLIGFRRAFIPVSIFGVLVVMLTCSLQLRRIFSRVQTLKFATARVAGGNFSERIEMPGGDEISELSRSFDLMSAEIGRNFALLRSVNHVDRAALEAIDVGELCGRVTRGLSDAFPGATRVVLLAESRDTSGAWTAFGAFAGPDGDMAGGSNVAEVAVPPTSVLRIAQMAAVGRLEQEELLDVVRIPGLEDVDLPEFFACFPLRLDGEAAGLLAVTCPGTDACAEDRERVRQLADQVAVALSNVRRLDQLERLNLGTLRALARTVDAGSEWTSGHSERVADFSILLAAELGSSPEDLERIQRGGLLHDIGKLGVSSHVLDKPDRLTDDEFQEMQRHPTIGANILEPLETFADILPMVLYHHERYDGRGYPAGLSGSAIPYEARIMAVADTFDALTSDRPYRDGLPVSVALRVIEEEAGRQFDPDMARAFITMMERRHGERVSTDEALPDSTRTGSMGVEQTRENLGEPAPDRIAALMGDTA